MLLVGKYSVHSDGNKFEFDVELSHDKKSSYLEVLIESDGVIRSAYKEENNTRYVYNNQAAKKVANILTKCLSKCNSKNAYASPWKYGVASAHEIEVKGVAKGYIVEVDKTLISCDVELFEKDLSARLVLQYMDDLSLEVRSYTNASCLKYIEMASESNSGNTEDNGGYTIRSLEEVRTMKNNLEWIDNVKYYIVNDEETAEQLFNYMENFKQSISYDVETSGKLINCFGKINSDYARRLEEYNRENPNEKIRSDYLVGFSYCVEPGVAYYFPCRNRKFKNLYSDKNNPIRKRIITNSKMEWTIGQYRDRKGDMRDYILNTPEDEWSEDVILMERNRKILETCNIVPFNASFEWRVDWIYEIDTNITDDPMLIHQLLYKFRSTTSNRGEPSNLKYLSLRELGIEQLSLSDFFVGMKDEDKDKGKVRGIRGSAVDFSYMEYEATRLYAPADVDCTLRLLLKYKKALREEFPEMEYLYQVELLVAMAIGYMEFYGHKIDFSKIENAKYDFLIEKIVSEYEILEIAGLNTESQKVIYEQLKKLDEIRHQYAKDNPESNEIYKKDEVDECLVKLRAEIDGAENAINMSAPGQVADLFYDRMGLPLPADGKKSVKKDIYLRFADEKVVDENGIEHPKYPIAKKYAAYKSAETMLTKFFDNLQNFMYPDGFIFSSYGQIAAATGRMNCKEPNAQQYPKAITNIVVPRKDCVFIDADFSQIEARITVGMAGSKYMIELFKDPDNDYHTLNASLMFGVPYASVTSKMRSDAKGVNFGLLYGMGIKSLARRLTGNSSKKDIENAELKKKLYFKNNPESEIMFDEIKEHAKVYGYTVTQFKRRRYYTFDGNGNNAKVAAALRQAGNAVIQGSAADIFKIAVARTFISIRNMKLLGKMFITNMIHDEQLTEVNVKELNIDKALELLVKSMQVSIDGFPPLFVGAGVGMTWKFAKGGEAEMHPHMVEEIIEKCKDVSIYSGSYGLDPKQVVDMFQKRLPEFGKKRVITYLLNKENWYKGMHPAISVALTDLYGIKGETFEETLERFIKDFKLDIYGLSVDMFKESSVAKDIEEERQAKIDGKGYDDDEEVEDGDSESTSEHEYKIIKEDDEVYGSSIKDIIRTFKIAIIPSKHILGIHSEDLHYLTIDRLAEYVEKHVCNIEDMEENDEYYEVEFLVAGNVLRQTGIYINNIDEEEIERIVNED